MGAGAFRVHVHDEAGVPRQERLLPIGVATVGAMGVCVEELSYRQPVGGRSSGD
jgi:hypothetical protein